MLRRACLGLAVIVGLIAPASARAAPITLELQGPAMFEPGSEIGVFEGRITLDPGIALIAQSIDVYVDGTRALTTRSLTDGRFRFSLPPFADRGSDHTVSARAYTGTPAQTDSPAITLVPTVRFVFEPSSVSFGSHMVGAPPVTRPVIIRNTGGSTSRAVSIVSSKPEFAFAGCAGVPLDPNEACETTLSFAPAAVGARVGTITASSADRASSSMTVAGTGTGLTGNGANFGKIAVGQTSAPMAVAVRNNASTTTGTISVSLGGPSLAEFTLVGDECSGVALAPAATCNVVVRFGPTSVGTKVITVTASATLGGTVVLTATGVGATAELSITPGVTDFGSAPDPETRTRQVSVANSGVASSGALSASVRSVFRGDFRIIEDACTGSSLAPGGSCSISIEWHPIFDYAHWDGRNEAVLVIDATPGGPVEAQLRGNATPA